METSVILSMLKTKGYRTTQGRTAIIDMFVLHKAPFTAKDIESYLVKRNVNINKATIYRELEFLLHENIISEISLSSQIQHYELSARPHHHHVICTKCGKIEDINIKKEEALISAVEMKTQFNIEEHSLEFYGKCNLCK